MESLSILAGPWTLEPKIRNRGLDDFGDERVVGYGQTDDAKEGLRALAEDRDPIVRGR